MSDLTCFKAYDIRGEIGVNIDEGIAYRIGRAVAQHFGAKSVVIGFDARETSSPRASAAWGATGAFTSCASCERRLRRRAVLRQTRRRAVA